jgi:predicted RNase H-like HicB family nuclease
MKRIIQFHVWRSDRFYVAQAADVPIVTQGSTLDEVVGNIKEAVDLYLEGEDLESLGFASAPQVIVSFEMTSDAVHA